MNLFSSFKYPFSRLPLKQREEEKDRWHVPQHLGIIMDGNRRYARKQQIWNIVQKRFGHAQGAEKLEEFLYWCQEVGIKIVSVWAFSLDNFKRDRAEIDTIFEPVKKKSNDIIHRPDIHLVNDIRSEQVLPTDVVLSQSW